MDQWADAKRLGGLRRFAVAITALNVVGHTVLGFEQSWAHLVVAMITTYVMELGLELIDARVRRRRPRYYGGTMALVDFLLSAHITAMAVTMLLYPNSALWPIVFAGATAIGSKHIFRIRAGMGSRHFLNPSNFGITATLLCFTWVGIAPPYQFTEYTRDLVDVLIPGAIIISGSYLNNRFTHRLPLIVSWLGGFLVQATLRSVVNQTPLMAALVPMTGMAFLLYTFYMATDPATTPSEPAMQVCFGLSLAAIYGMLQILHVVFGLFLSLTILCAVRGAGIGAYSWLKNRPKAASDATSPAVVTVS